MQTDATTPNIVTPAMLGVVACVLALVCKRMQQLSSQRFLSRFRRSWLLPTAEDVSAFGQHRKFPPMREKPLVPSVRVSLFSYVSLCFPLFSYVFLVSLFFQCYSMFSYVSLVFLRFALVYYVFLRYPLFFTLREPWVRAQLLGNIYFSWVSLNCVASRTRLVRFS